MEHTPLLEESAVGGMYDPPANYGIPNPLGPRVHNWKGGPLNEGSLYHGPVYTRPSYTLPWAPRPLFGLGQEEEPKASALGVVLPVLLVAGVIAILFWPKEKKKPKRREPTPEEIRARRIENIENRKWLIAQEAPIRKKRDAAKKRGDMEEYRRLDDELFRIRG